MRIAAGYRVEHASSVGAVFDGACRNCSRFSLSGRSTVMVKLLEALADRSIEPRRLGLVAERSTAYSEDHG